jgi:hypothetical protein
MVFKRHFKPLDRSADMLKTPKPDVCEQPAYLFWKLQSRLTKLANQLEKSEKAKQQAQQTQSSPKTSD